MPRTARRCLPSTSHWIRTICPCRAPCDELDMDATRAPHLLPMIPRVAEERANSPCAACSAAKTNACFERDGHFNWRRGWGGCLLRGFIAALFGLVIFTLIGGSGLLFSYYSIARTLPSVEDLQTRASQFETTRILDRNGNLLYEILDPSAGRRTYVTLDKISPVLSRRRLPPRTRIFTAIRALIRGRSRGHCGKTIVPGDRAEAHPRSRNNWRARFC